MAALSNTYETSVLTWLLTGDAVTRPSSFYIGLFTTDPTDADSGTEVSGGAYVRQPASFTVSGDAATTTAAAEWPVATADWGTITHVAVYDAATGGSIIAHAALTEAKPINTDDVFRVPTGGLDITLD